PGGGVVGRAGLRRPIGRSPLRRRCDRMTEWSGVVETQYGTINLAEPNLPPAEVDFDLFWEEKCATLGGGIQVSLREQNGDVPVEVRVLDEPAPIEDYWDHVAEVGLHAPGGRLQVFSWMADVDLAAEL